MSRLPALSSFGGRVRTRCCDDDVDKREYSKSRASATRRSTRHADVVGEGFAKETLLLVVSQDDGKESGI